MQATDDKKKDSKGAAKTLSKSQATQFERWCQVRHARELLSFHLSYPFFLPLFFRYVPLPLTSYLSSSHARAHASQTELEKLTGSDDTTLAEFLMSLHSAAEVILTAMDTNQRVVVTAIFPRSTHATAAVPLRVAFQQACEGTRGMEQCQTESEEPGADRAVHGARVREKERAHCRPATELAGAPASRAGVPAISICLP